MVSIEEIIKQSEGSLEFLLNDEDTSTESL